MVNVSLKGKEE
jgi:hypothetical protein